MPGGPPLVLRDGDGNEHVVSVEGDGSVTVDGAPLRVTAAADGTFSVAADVNAIAWAVNVGGTRWVFLDGDVFTFEEQRVPRRRTASHQGSLTAPMPATVRQVAVRPGDAVKRGDVLLVLEAMKMELPVRAAADATVSAVHCREGDLVQPGVSLIEFEQ